MPKVVIDNISLDNRIGIVKSDTTTDIGEIIDYAIMLDSGTGEVAINTATITAVIVNGAGSIGEGKTAKDR